MKLWKTTLTTLVAVTMLVTLSQSASADEGHNHAHGHSKLTKRDQLKVAAQKICPVSGKKLGGMGTPLKIKIGQEELFLCCNGCTTGQVSREHWGTIHANFAKAQGECPVMEKPLPKNPKWTIVNGQIVYICCPPCSKKIQADPKTYLTKLDALYAKSQAKNKAATRGFAPLR